MILRHMIDIDETVKLTQGQGHKVKGHFLQKSTFGSMKMCICIKQARLTYLRGVNVLVYQSFLFEGRTLPGGRGMGAPAVWAKCRLGTVVFVGFVAAPSTNWLVLFPALCAWVSKPKAGVTLKWLRNKKRDFTF